MTIETGPFQLFTFTNGYLSPIQCGIQTAHVVSELFTKYERAKRWNTPLFDWARKDKTICVLNGINCANLQTIKDFLYDWEGLLPWAYFEEDDASLNGALTCVGVLVPERLYKRPRPDQFSTKETYLDTLAEWCASHGVYGFEQQLLLILNEHRRA